MFVCNATFADGAVTRWVIHDRDEPAADRATFAMPH